MATLLSIRASIDEDDLRDTFEIAMEKQIDQYYEDGKRRKGRKLKRISRSERRSEMAFQYALDNSITAFIASGKAATQAFGDGAFLDWFKNGGWESIIAFLERLIPLLIGLFGIIAFLALMLMPLDAVAQCPSCAGESVQSFSYSASAPVAYGSNGSSLRTVSRSYGSNGSSFSSFRARSWSGRRWTPIRNMLSRASNRRASRVNARRTRWASRSSGGSNGSRITSYSFGSNGSGLSAASYIQTYQPVSPPQARPVAVAISPKTVSVGWLGDPVYVSVATPEVIRQAPIKTFSAPIQFSPS